MTFSELSLSAPLIKAADALGFQQPTPVQEKAIPFLLNEKDDLMALAQTGTGKTAAFGFPLLHFLSANSDKTANATRALLLAPTRELCLQIANDLKQYAQFLPQIRIVAVYGGEDIRKQLMLLDKTPQIIVATPGRLLDLMRRGKVKLSGIEYLVLDEADEMLNMGFQEDIETILQEVPDNRRTMLFSATMPREIAQISKQYMHNAHEIQIGERNAGTENVEHIYYVCRAQERYLVLKRIIDYNPDIYGIIFCRTKADTQEVAEKLMKDGYNADALHGDLTQTARDNVMQRFRLKAVRLLIATDVAARGIDVNCLTHVINYQLPDDPEVYTHRSGRTGRAQQKGISISILHQRETRRIHNLEKMLHREFHYQPIPMPIDVCKKQLFYQVGKLQKADTDLLNSSQFTADVLDEALKVLNYLSKEELLTHFLALEFNRFLSYYKDAKDLNVEKPAPKHRDDRKPNKREKEHQGNNRMIRLKINVGKRDGMSPKRFLALVNEVTHDRSIHIGNIDIAQNFTFFDIFPDQRRKLENGFAIYEDLYIQEVKGKRADKF